MDDSISRTHTEGELHKHGHVFTFIGDRGSPGPPGLPAPSGIVLKGDRGEPGSVGLQGFSGPRGRKITLFSNDLLLTEMKTKNW